MKTELTEQDIDDIIYRIQDRVKKVNVDLWCRRCDKRLGFEDAFILCVACQNELGSKKIKELIKKEQPQKQEGEINGK